MRLCRLFLLHFVLQLMMVLLLVVLVIAVLLLTIRSIYEAIRFSLSTGGQGNAL